VAFNKTQKDAFDWYVNYVLLHDKDFDFYQACKEFDIKLKDLRLGLNSAQYFAKVFDELEYPSIWKPTTLEKERFFGSLPENIIKGKWDIIKKYIPRDKWGEYNSKYAQASKAISSFVKSLDPEEPLILLNEDQKKNLIFSVFLGDITARLGINQEDMDNRYDSVYDAIEKELGYDAIKNHIPKNIEIIDWPNASVITNAKYEFLVKKQRDPAIADIKNSIIVALNKLGL